MIARPVIRSGPERTCLGCRQRDGQQALLRLVADGDHVVVDSARRLPGRGVWVHRAPRCAGRLTLGAVERGLRRKLSGDSFCKLQLLPGTPER